MRLILHAGTHKTGTTSIQKVLADHRDSLRRQGLIYPDGGAAFPNSSVPHHKFSHILTGVEDGWREKAVAFIAGATESARPGDALLISAEPVYRHVFGYAGWDRFTDPGYWTGRKRYLEVLAGVLRDFEVEVVLFLREKESFSRSLYHEVVVDKGHWSGGYEEFMTAFAPWFEYDRQISLFRSVFADVRIFSYEDASSAGLLSSFFGIIGFPTPENADSVWLRRSS